MAFLDKATMLSEAERLHVDLEGLTWQQQQKAVLNAQAEEKAGNLKKDEQPKIAEGSKNEDIVDDDVDLISVIRSLEEAGHSKTASIIKELAAIANGEREISLTDRVEEDTDTPHEISEAVVQRGFNEPNITDGLHGRRFLLTPEMAPTARQYFKYDEELDEELEVEDVYYDPDHLAMTSNESGVRSATYKIKGSNGRKVVAQSTLPKENTEISWNPDIERVPITKFQGKTGYLWSHQSYPNIKQLLVEAGKYEKYKDRFSNGKIWHSGGKILACDITLANEVLDEIERDWARDHE